MLKKLTDKQKKTLLIVLGVIVASYIVKWIVGAAQQAALVQQQASRAAQQRNNAPGRGSNNSGAKAGNKQAKRPPRTVLTDLTNLSGTWVGQRLLNKNGMCTLRLELRPVPETPENYKGYSRLIKRFTSKQT